jgi:hypothetical protein
VASGTADVPGLREALGRYLTFADVVAMADEPYRAQKEAVIGRTFQPGLVIPIAVFTGHLDTHWLVSDDDDDGTVNVSAVGSMDYPPFACLVNHKGEVVTYNPSPATSPELAEAVPDDGVWYSVVVRAAWVTRGRGRLTLASGSAAVVGSGTAFARMVAQDDIPVPPLLNQPTKIRIASGGSNDGDYSVKTITSDTAITLTTNAAATETVAEGDWYEIGYWITDASPTSEAAYQRLVPEFEIVDVVATPDDGDYVLCDVMRDSGSTPQCTFRDRRAENRWIPLPWSPEQFSSLDGAAAVLLPGHRGIIGEDESGRVIGSVRTTLESDAGEYVSAIDTSGQYVVYATWDGSAAKLYRADRYLANPEEITLTSSTSEVKSLRTDGAFIAVAYGQKVELFTHTTMESLWVYDHGATVYDVALSGEAVFLGGAVGTGTKDTRAIELATGLELWSYTHGATVYSVTTDCNQVYIGGGAGTSTKHIRALACSDGTVAWSYEAPAALDRPNALCVDRSRLYYVVYDDTIYSLGIVLGNEIASFTELNWQKFTAVCVDERFLYAAIADSDSGPAVRRVVAFDPGQLTPVWTSTVTGDNVAFKAIATDGCAVFVGLEDNGAASDIAARLVSARGSRIGLRVDPQATYDFQRQLVIFGT